MTAITRNKIIKVVISFIVLFIGGVVGDLAFIGFTSILNGTAEASDKVYTLIYSGIFWIIFIALFVIKKRYDLKWVRRLFIPAPIILTLLILVGGAIVYSTEKEVTCHDSTIRESEPKVYFYQREYWTDKYNKELCDKITI